ncbi:MAG: hypothetical protein ACLU9S_05835 [Oscillospiraceae bacterium]
MALHHCGCAGRWGVCGTCGRYTFTNNEPELHQRTIHARFTLETFPVRFLNWDGTQDVPYGEAAEAPEAPNRPFHTFLCWDRDFSKITRPVDEMTKQGKTIWAQGHKKQPHGFAVGL